MIDFEYKPLVSIITVVYNGERYLEQTIKSVLNQSYSNIEYLIIDGGSTDGTIEIIKKFEDKLSFWLSEKDNGVYDAMNKGISIANGEIIGIINSDDYYSSFAVQEAVNKLVANDNYEIFFGNLRRIYSSNKNKKINIPIPTTIPENKINIVHPTVFVKKRVYARKMFDSTLKIAADLDFLFTICNVSNIIKSEKIISNMRTGGLSSNFLISIKEMFLVYRRFLTLHTSILIMLRYLLIKIPVILLQKSGLKTQ